MKTNKYGKFDTIATHYRAHLDEIVAAVLLQRFGEFAFPGVSKAELSFLQKDPRSVCPGTIYVGIGGEKFGPFDEHRPEGRLQNTCAALLVAQRLNVCQKRGVRELVKDTLWSDTTQKVSPSQLGNLVKTMHRVKSGNDQLGTFLWTAAAIDAIMFSETVDESYDICVSWKNFCEDEKIKPTGRLNAFIATAHKCCGKFVTELGMICALMNPKIRQRWLPELFQAFVKDSELFEQAVWEINNDAETFEVITPVGTHPVMMIKSDSEIIARAAASSKTGKAAITVVRNSSGLTQILTDHEKGLDLKPLKQMIRMAEYKARTGQTLPKEKALGEGLIPECPEWFFPNDNTLLNGSFTHPSEPPSKLGMKTDIKNVLEHAFLPQLREKWFKQYYAVQPVNPSEVKLHREIKKLAHA